MPRTALLSDAIDEFENFRRSQDIAKTTIANYRVTLKRFMAVSGNIWCHAITDRHVTAFFMELSKTKQPHSQRNDHVALEVFFEFVRHQGYMTKDSDPMWGRRKPVARRRERNRIHVSKFPALLDAAERRCPRDRAALAVLLYTLKRDSEVTTIQLWDVDLDAGYIRVRLHKTKQEDRIPICAELDRELRRWLTYYTEHVGQLQDHYYLLPARDTEGVRNPASGLYSHTTQSRIKPEQAMSKVGYVCKEAMKGIGFPVVDAQGKPLYEGSHTIRRSGARALFDVLVEQGYDRALRIVQSMLGHASLEETERYVGITADKRSRDDLLRGQVMYPVGSNVVELHRSEDGHAAGSGH